MTTDFSVSMCVYAGDNAEHFDTAVNSVVDQTLKPSEVVLTVDGPIPAAISDVIDKYDGILQKEGIAFKVVRLEKNMGHGEARRTSLGSCSHPLVALMDSDDISARDRFEKEIEAFISDPELSIVGGHIAEFKDDDPENITAKRSVKLTDREIKEDMKTRCPMNQPTVMFRQKDVQEVGGYIDWFCNEDYYLWIRLALADKKFRNIDEVLVKMRVDESFYKRRGGYKYYKSEAGIQKLLLSSGYIGVPTYLVNKIKRFVVQVMLPNSVRSWALNMFARQ